MPSNPMYLILGTPNNGAEWYFELMFREPGKSPELVFAGGPKADRERMFEGFRERAARLINTEINF